MQTYLKLKSRSEACESALFNFYMETKRVYNWDLDKLSANQNITFDQITELKNRYFNLEGISNNPNISLKIIRENPSVRWNWSYLSLNPAFSMETIMQNKHLPWDWRLISKDGALTAEILRNNMDVNWNWYFLSRNDNIPYSEVLSSPDLPWDMDEFYQAETMPVQMLIDLVDAGEIERWSFVLGNNPGISMSFLLENDRFQTSRHRLVQNPGLTVRDLAENLQFFLKYEPFPENLISAMHCNPNVTLAEVQQFPEFPWNFKNLSYRDGITTGDILENPQYDWDLTALSTKKDVTVQFIKDHPEIPWDFSLISENPFPAYRSMCEQLERLTKAYERH
jgi:hypothetical protein